MTDKFIHQRYFHLAFYIALLALSNGLLTYSSLWLFFVLCFLNGAATGATDSAGNVLSLDIWRGHGGEHWMHLLHFSFAAGAFLGPVVVKPFLSTSANATASDMGPPSNSSTSGDISDDGDGTSTERYGIQVLYPILAAVAGSISLTFLAWGVYTSQSPSMHQELRKPGKRQEPTAKDEDQQTDQKAGFIFEQEMRNLKIICGNPNKQL